MESRSNTSRSRSPLILVRSWRDLLLEPVIPVQGFFRVTLLDAAAFRHGKEVVRRQLCFPNLILDNGLNKLCNAPDGEDHLDVQSQVCVVGLGSTAPAVGQTALVSLLANTSSNGGFSDGGGNSGVPGPGPGTPHTYHYMRRTRLFLEAEANGNLTEVGFGETTTSLWTRQLFRDELGNPTTITKTSAELLRVEYEFRVYVPQTVTTLVGLTIGSQTIDVDMHPVNANKGSGWGALPMWLGSADTPGAGGFGMSGHVSEDQVDHSADFKGTPVMNASVSAPWSHVTHTPGVFKVQALYQYGLSVANFATGIGSLLWGGPITTDKTLFPHYARFNPKILKTSSDKLNITVSLTLSRAVIP